MTALVLPRDVSGFLRRECPHCRRQFKIRSTGDEAGSVHRVLAGVVPHENADEADVPPPSLHCLYCGKRGPFEEFLTPQQRFHVERMAQSFAEEVRYQQLTQVHRTLSQNPNPTFVPLAPPRAPGPMRADDDDLDRVYFLCCGEDAKLAPRWERPLFCPACGAEHRHGAKRVAMSLDAIEA